MSPAPAGSNPYVGLRPFDREDSLYFFGRREQTSELLERLHQHRFLGVVGSSGCGKSSLIRAGLIPALFGGFLVEKRDKWLIAVMKPGDAPMCNLSAALLRACSESAQVEEIESLEKSIIEDQTDAIAEHVGPRLGADTNLLLLVDQFEEIFSFRGTEDDEQFERLSPTLRRERSQRRAEAANFVDLILALSAQSGLPVYVVLTMRSDFLGDCDLFYGFPEAMNRSRYLVPRPTRAQLRDAVQGPALLSGVAIAPRLLDTVLNDLGGRSDQLPVLQHALFRTWNTWHRDGKGPLDLTHYDSIGGLKDALSRHANEAIVSSDIAITARIFKCLTDTDPNQRRIRRPAHMRELVAVSGGNAAAVQAIVDRFRGDGRNFLVLSDSRGGDTRIDISHESLIRQWPQLRDWIDEESASRDHYLDLVKSARGHRALLQDPDLQLALKWRDEASPTPEWAARYSEREDDFKEALDYLQRSRNEAAAALRQKERFNRNLRAGIAAVIIALAGLMAYAFVEKAKAQEARNRAARAEDVALKARRDAVSYADLTQKRLAELSSRALIAERKLEDLGHRPLPVEVAAPGPPVSVEPPAPPPYKNKSVFASQESEPHTIPDPVTLTLSPLGGRSFTYSKVSLNGHGNTIKVSPGEDFTISFLWEGSVVTTDLRCPGCIVQLYYGISRALGGTSKCFVSDKLGVGWHGKGDVKGTLTAPKAPGTYYVTQTADLDYSCEESKIKQSRNPKDAIAMVVVE